MAGTGWTRYTPHALVGAVVFAFMHVADELAGNWDAGAPGGSLGEPTSAAVALGVMTLVGMWGLWWIVTDRAWGYGLAALLGLQFLLTGGAHFLNPADMTAFRWVVVALEVAFSAVVVVLGVGGLRVHRPWR